jgi:hypothetical protein
VNYRTLKKLLKRDRPHGDRLVDRRPRPWWHRGSLSQAVFSITRAAHGRVQIWQPGEREGSVPMTDPSGAPLSFSTESEACDYIWAIVQESRLPKPPAPGRTPEQNADRKRRFDENQARIPATASAQAVAHDDNLSAAVRAYIGRDTASFPHELPEAVRALFRGTTGDAVLDRTIAIVRESSSMRLESAPDDTAGTYREVQLRLCAQFPELSPSAIEALAWRISFIHMR